MCLKVSAVFAFLICSPANRNAGRALMNGSVSWHLVLTQSGSSNSARKWELVEERVCEWRVDELLISFSPPTIWPMRHCDGQGPHDNTTPGTSLEQFSSSLIFALLCSGRTLTSHLLSRSDAAPAFVSEVAVPPRMAGSTLLDRTGNKDADLSSVRMSLIQFSSQLVVAIKKWYMCAYKSHCAQLQVACNLWNLFPCCCECDSR